LFIIIFKDIIIFEDVEGVSSTSNDSVTTYVTVQLRLQKACCIFVLCSSMFIEKSRSQFSKKQSYLNALKTLSVRAHLNTRKCTYINKLLACIICSKTHCGQIWRRSHQNGFQARWRKY